jgi:hypothetical protein
VDSSTSIAKPSILILDEGLWSARVGVPALELLAKNSSQIQSGYS